MGDLGNGKKRRPASHGANFPGCRVSGVIFAQGSDDSQGCAGAGSAVVQSEGKRQVLNIPREKITAEQIRDNQMGEFAPELRGKFGDWKKKENLHHSSIDEKNGGNEET